MNQLSKEQQEQLRQIKARLENVRPEEPLPIQVLLDANYLLVLLDSDIQAAAANYSKLAHEIISEYNSADDPGLLRIKVAEGFAQVASDVASAMRDKCAQAVDDFFSLSQQEMIKKYGTHLLSAVMASLTLDQVKPGEM